ncbi:hypothetical protein IFM89_004330 [Coptis chinensis]|uniref:Protein kinase domain-containing protein n=1 Tax=Coptis chinensis TaxID=261450 RepID=A0A835I968_9MAGN|nr:hypothetical protein IFM89_004330 [Coptis chinensis]
MDGLVLLLILVFCCFTMFSSVTHIGARPDPLSLQLSSISAAPILSPQTQQPPLSATMYAVSPGVKEQVKNSNSHHLNKRMLIALVLVSSALFVILSFLVCFWICWSKNSQKSDSIRSDGGRGISLAPILGKFNSMRMIGSSISRKGSVSMIEYPLLEAATNNFWDNNILGQGGFGCVYKGCFNNNFLAAVKKMNCGGQDVEREFENEVDLLSKIRHPNILSLLGYCIHGETRFIVTELMQNGSLETQLHGPSHGSALTWDIRMKIALDAARGLEYLHENCNPPVIHRDLKSSNILLDSNFNAKLSDFGLAVINGTQNKNNIKLSGTLGYVAPEYLLDGRLTDKSDVYAFGVILLELLMGRKPVEKMTPSQCQSIVTWAMPQLTDRSKLPNIVDPVIRNTMDLKHLYQVAAVAVLCVQPEPSYRPLITDVLHSLVPLVPVELGGTLRVTDATPVTGPKPA